MKAGFVVAESIPFDLKGNLQKYVTIIKEMLEKDSGIEAIVLPVNAIEGFFSDSYFEDKDGLPFYVREFSKLVSGIRKRVIYPSSNHDKIFEVYAGSTSIYTYDASAELDDTTEVIFVKNRHIINKGETHKISFAPFLFDGERMYKGGCVLSKAGKALTLIDAMKEGYYILDTKNIPELADKSELKVDYEQPERPFYRFDAEDVYHTLVESVRRYFSLLGVRKAVVGLSGGIDSAVVASIGVAALGSDNVTGILMPSEFSTGHSVTDAEQLAKNLGMEYHIVPIKELYHSYNDALKEVFKGKEFDVTEENIQARIRGTLVMAYANKFGAMALNTSNKSELMVGYGTLYGDLVGSIGVIGDVFKTEVYQLADYINRNGELIPKHIIEKAPSAELRPGQKDQDALPDYPLLDKILISYLLTMKHSEVIYNDVTFSEAVADRFYHLYGDSVDKEVVKQVISLIFRNHYKGRQVPPKIVLGLYPEAELPLLFKGYK